MLVVQDVGVLAYGGLKTGLDQWDKRRVSDGRIGEDELFKKAGTYGYLVPGVFCTVSTAFGWMRRWDAWNERIAHGFIYGFPGFVMDMVDAFTEGGVSEKSSAIREAEKILAGKTSTKRAGWKPQGIVA